MAEHANRRDFSRVETHIDAEVDCGGKTVCGQLDDVSMQGVRITSDEELPLHAACQVRLLLSDPSEENSECIKAQGKIVRSTENDIGIEFTGVYMESFEHLQNLVRLNASNVSQVEGEFRSHLGLKRPKAS